MNRRYADSLGILGAGPLGGFTASMVVTNADGYRYVVAPMVDGYHLAGLPGQRQSEHHEVPAGHGPAAGPSATIQRIPPTDYFSLGQGTPQVWEPNVYAAGTAVVRDPHRQVHHDSAEHARPAPDDGADRLRDVGLDLGPERQPHGGEGDSSIRSGLRSTCCCARWVCMATRPPARTLLAAPARPRPTNSRRSCCRR